MWADDRGSAVALGKAPVETDGRSTCRRHRKRRCASKLLDAAGRPWQRKRGWFWARQGRSSGFALAGHAGPERARRTLPQGSVAHPEAVPGQTGRLEKPCSGPSSHFVTHQSAETTPYPGTESGPRHVCGGTLQACGAYPGTHADAHSRFVPRGRGAARPGPSWFERRHPQGGIASRTTSGAGNWGRSSKSTGAGRRLVRLQQRWLPGSVRRFGTPLGAGITIPAAQRRRPLPHNTLSETTAMARLRTSHRPAGSLGSFSMAASQPTYDNDGQRDCWSPAMPSSFCPHRGDGTFEM